MKYRYEVGVEYIDAIHYIGESSGVDIRTYDVEAEDIFQGHDMVRALTEPLKKNPCCIVRISSPKLLGAVCGHCQGKGVLSV